MNRQNAHVCSLTLVSQVVMLELLPFSVAQELLVKFYRPRKQPLSALERSRQRSDMISLTFILA